MSSQDFQLPAYILNVQNEKSEFSSQRGLAEPAPGGARAQVDGGVYAPALLLLGGVPERRQATARPEAEQHVEQ